MSEERTQINVTIDDDRIQLILPGDGWTFEEAKLAKAISEGMAPSEIEDRLLLSDPDAWLAILRVSYMRANKDYPAQAIAQTDILKLAKQVTDNVRQAVTMRPPTNPSGNGSTEPAKPLEPVPPQDLS